MNDDTTAAADVDDDNPAGPVTSTGHLGLAAESVRLAAHAPAPATPPEVYDQLAAITELTQRLDQHLRRCADALNKAAASPLLRAANNDPDPGFLARHAAFLLSNTATERLAGLTAELNNAWSSTSALYLADPEPAQPDDE